jgi:hypothetical protein
MQVNMEVTLAKVRVANPPLPNESDSQYAARTLHLAYLLIEHSPQSAVLMPDQEKEDIENE